MAIEDEYCHVYQNMQGRYEDGHRVIVSRVDINNAEEMTVRELEMEIPIPHQRAFGTVWTPNQFTAYATDQPMLRYRRRIT